MLVSSVVWKARLLRYSKKEQSSLPAIVINKNSLEELKEELKQYVYKTYYTKLTITKHTSTTELVEEISSFPPGLDPES
jgi:hypothetical protein